MTQHPKQITRRGFLVRSGVAGAAALTMGYAAFPGEALAEGHSGAMISPNMFFDIHADGRVVVVADIDKGGVFAQCVGTLACMPPEDRARVSGFIINRFRGEPSLFAEGVRWLEKETGRPVLGVVPWSHSIHVELEDELSPDARVDGPPPDDDSRFQVAVLRVPHLSNMSDFDALERHGVGVHFLSRPRDLSAYDLVVLPGSKNTLSDLSWLHRLGWNRVLARHAAGGGAILGICGGFQMLGRTVADPHGIEGQPGTSVGLGLLAVDTVFGPTKVTRPARGRLGTTRLEGYEIHVGQTTVEGDPLLWLDKDGGERPDGARQGAVMGTYLHGLFDGVGAVAALLSPIRPDLDWPELPPHAHWRETQLDALADHLRTHLGEGLRGM